MLASGLFWIVVAIGFGLWQGAITPPWEWGSIEGGTVGSASRFFDKDCADFRTWAEAQAFFERAGSGDPHRLDADGDGIACEALRRR